MKFTPGIVDEAPGYYVDHFNGKYDVDKTVILRDMSLETDSEVMEPSLKQLSKPTHILDLTNNLLTGFPTLRERADIHTMLLSRNHINTINGKLLPRNLVNLVLAHNSIDSFEQLKGFKNSPSTLVNLTLRGNSICHLENYRLHVIKYLPQLQILDFSKVKDAERKESEKLQAYDQTITPLDDNSGSRKRKLEDSALDIMHIVVGKMSEETKKDLKRQLATATSLEEIERIEKLLSGGI
ncbi:hypothetical protein TPHA_0J02460 [Tetrapisispora phaffii CBS 4417]|uniref:U2 small nuclear ribonucleoprotein A' n=1 Tax=Tetrapisispora phaffii (strain ATCC 24235 / CBS 4417 / NBRC 1672 / NRRL Y-8282 / UCD 70-5) TaxID=1071381 RepID=G8BYX4_TETPH|nr:hypothetical protein TPHA_0J02460 [Tetrapisispora phaffii CBS 4417]CCE65066.1 hypothetical protein TPHA_0J02460 [Tetrapisispora phaffii CBS 4417]